MTKRIVFGSIMIALLVGIFLLDGLWAPKLSGKLGQSLPGVILAAIFLPLLLLGFVEYARMAKEAGTKVLWFSGLIGTALLAIQPIAGKIVALCGGKLPSDSEINIFTDFRLWAGLVVMLVFLNQMIVGRLEDAIRRVACTLLGILYLGVGGALLLSLRTTTDSIWMLIMFLAVVKGTDICAYFTGSFIGKHKMIPWLSPGKSWEGLAGGVTGAALIGLGFWALGKACDLAVIDIWWQAMIFGAICGLVGQFADLCESLMKRSAGVKDSGALLPEFGGVLDLLDSPLLAAPVGWLILHILGLFVNTPKPPLIYVTF